MPEVNMSEEGPICFWSERELKALRKIRNKPLNTKARNEEKEGDSKRIWEGRIRYMRYEAVSMLMSTGCFTRKELSEVMNLNPHTLDVILTRMRKQRAALPRPDLKESSCQENLSSRVSSTPDRQDVVTGEEEKSSSPLSGGLVS